MNLYATLAAGFPADKAACCLETQDGQYYSWADIAHASARIAHLLASLDLQPDARIAVQVEKSPEALLLYLACLRAGYVYLPLNTAYQAAEIAYFIADAAPEVVVCAPQNFGWVSQIAFKHGCRHVYTLDAPAQGPNSGTLLQRAAPFPDEFDTLPRQPDQLAAILYTSGTTGRSKGAMLSHGNLASNAAVLQRAWRWQPGDVLLHTLPLFHVHGLFVACHGALLNGSKMIFLPKFDAAQALEYLPRSTVFMGVPTYYVRLLAQAGFDSAACRNIRLFVSGSAPLLMKTFTAFTQRSGHTILERYGMSETTMLTSNPYAGQRKGGTVGLPLEGVAVRVVQDDQSACACGEIGEIQVQGPNVFRGYWHMPEKTAQEFTADGYFRTGDVGRFDTDGYLSIVGRNKDLIISGGYNVYPKEIESFIDELPGVLESAVIGVPHAEFGEAVTAVLVLRPGAALDEAAVIAALKAGIANFKVPKRVHFVPELPRNAMGKVQKNLLRQAYANN